MLTSDQEQTYARLERAFMRPEIYHGAYWEVSANGGETHIVPADVCDDVDALAEYVDGTIDTDDDDQPEAERKIGYLARLSAPGYLDATDWTAHETENEARVYLVDTYGNDDEQDQE